MADTTPSSRRRLRPWLLPGAVAVAIALAIGLYLFQPWRAFTNRTVIEALPSVAAAPPPAATTTTAPPVSATPEVAAAPPETAAAPSETAAAPSQAAAGPPPQTPPAAPSPSPAPTEITELAGGTLISHEHTTSGTVSLLQLPDGTQILRLTGLDTSDGPDLRVWLTDAPVIDGRDGWFVFDDGRYVDLGPLKGNLGDQNYEIPPGTDLRDLDSISIWCRRFAVSFGAAALMPAA